ncbi:12585_t:CDS:1, partial [Funneliformis geosporum]
VISVKHKPLASITNNMHINKLRNNSLNNSNKATDRTLNYYLHLINTSCYTTPHSSSCSTNTYLSILILRSPYLTDTPLSMAYNVYPSKPHTLRSTNARSFTSHSNNTNFNNNVFRSNTSNVFHLNTSLNDNTDIRLIFDTFNDDEFRSNNTSF